MKPECGKLRGVGRWCLLVVAAAAVVLIRLSAAAADAEIVSAVKSGDRTTVQRLVKQHADVNASEPDGTTALHWAVRSDDVETVRLLLRGGANAKAANRYGVTPLSLAAVNGDAAVIALLLDRGADPNTASEDGETVLMTAARTGKVDVVRALLIRGAKPNAKENFQGETALMWAAAENHVAVTRVLLEAGAEVDARSTLLDTPKLSFPRSGGPNTPFPRGSRTALMYAARQGAVDTARALAERGAALDLKDPEGTTALMFAIINAHYDTAAVLIDKGADPNVVDTSGMSALYAAVDMNTLRWTFGRPAPFQTDKLRAADVVKSLLDHGADPNLRLRRALLARHHDPGDRQLSTGSTALMRAVKTGDAELTRLLLDHGADGTIIQPNGTTVLMIAAGVGTAPVDTVIEVEAPRVSKVTDQNVLKVLELCAARCGDVNAFNADGDTALHGAVNRGPDIVRFILEHGGSADMKNKRGLAPLDLALGAGGRGRGAARPESASKVRQASADLIRQYLPKTEQQPAASPQ
jgi:ankyrin repeat protein